jgi:ATPase subunit of ABC transporter with duplicated ATPase domains
MVLEKLHFLKILSGQEEATEGEVQIQNGKKVGTLSQNQFAYENNTIFDAVLLGNKRLHDAVKEKEELYMSPEFTDEVNNRLAELEIICCEEDPTYEYDVKITKNTRRFRISSCISSRFNEYINRWR